MLLLFLNILIQQEGDNFEPGTACGGLFVLLMVVYFFIRIFRKKPTRKNKSKVHDAQRRSSEDPLEVAISARRAAKVAKSTSVQVASDAGRGTALASQRLGSMGNVAGFCGNCGTPHLSADKFCTKCGTAIREMIIEQAPPTSSGIPEDAVEVPVHEREAGISSESIMIASEGELARMLYLLDKRSGQEYISDKAAFLTSCELIKEIGRELDSQGGEELMKKVLVRARALGCNARFIEGEWDGIGTWMG